tara:strand:- start:1589 stop:1846 length:258 start_codon:yes stop_codon:yes gene_type:complete
MVKTNKKLKQKQASMQSDQLELGFADSGDIDTNFSYSFGYSFEDIGELQNTEEDLREKYPALKQAHEHYQSVLEVCKTKEAEDEN